MKAVFLCFVFGSIIGFALSAEGDSNARLLISKNILNQFVVEGKELTVHYSIYNVGSGPATSVLLTDNSFPADQFNVLHGLLSVKWKAIAPGTNVSHTIILEPKRSGVFNFTSAQVSYKASEDATDPQIVFSTLPGEGGIMAQQEYDRKHSPHLKGEVIMDLRRSRVTFLANDVKAKADVLCARVPQRTPRPALGWKMLPALPKRLEIESKQLHDPIKLNRVSFARTFK